MDNEWLTNHKNASLEKKNFLYVGRISPEKGIEDFFKIFEKLDFDARLSVVGNLSTEEKKIKNVNFYGYVSDPKTLISIYDNHNITILPSYTEATPYVVDESLARLRPVIIFEDIKYIKRNKEGIFISKRDINSFSQNANFIINNYSSIQKKMSENKLPTKDSMIQQLSKIIKN